MFIMSVFCIDRFTWNLLLTIIVICIVTIDTTANIKSIYNIISFNNDSFDAEQLTAIHTITTKISITMKNSIVVTCIKQQTKEKQHK